MEQPNKHGAGEKKRLQHKVLVFKVVCRMVLNKPLSFCQGKLYICLRCTVLRCISSPYLYMPTMCPMRRS